MKFIEIKDIQEAISKMENEIASRNPFVALHKSIQDIGDAKTEFTTALQEWHTAQEALTTAQQEYNAALAEEQALRGQINRAIGRKRRICEIRRKIIAGKEKSCRRNYAFNASRTAGIERPE